METRFPVLVYLAAVTLAGVGCSSGGGNAAGIVVYGDGHGGQDGPGDKAQGEAHDPEVVVIKCEKDLDCASGLCLELMADHVCAMACQDGECADPAMRCFNVRGFKDERLCLPKTAMLCMPCEKDEECSPLEEPASAVCFQVADRGRFCSYPCLNEQTNECPPGYNCKALELPGGALVGQCRPKIDQCVCNEVGRKSGWAVACGYDNEFGKCSGETKCPASGPAECTVLPPVAETCNVEDDDCDGDTDEGIAGVACGGTDMGECAKGQIVCTGGAESCQGEIVASPEGCDGKDNDCDGLTDEDFPEKGTICGTDVGLCKTGYSECKKGELGCYGDTPPAAEICDGKDNDCDGKTDLPECTEGE